MGLFSSSSSDTQVYAEGADSTFQNSRAYMMALLAYMGIFLFGYDSGVAGGIVSLVSFQKDFGYANASDKTKADSNSNVVSLLMIGAFVGALGAAPLCTKIGRKQALMWGVGIFLIGGIIQTAALHSLGQMIAGRVIAGVGVGLMSTVCPSYVSEAVPKNVRGRITGLFQVVVVVGVAASYWIEYLISVRMKESSAQWRIPIGIQLVPAGIMAVLLPFMKESPRWLMSKGRDAEALANLAWIRKRGPDDPFVQEEFMEMKAAFLEDQAATAGGSFKTSWKPGNRIRFFIAVAMFVLQQWSGQNSISYYAPTIFKSIGLRGVSTGLLASGIYGLVKIIATSIFISVGIERTGRRLSLGCGAAAMGTLLFMIGAVFITHVPDAKATSPAPASIGMAALIYIFVIPYCFSWGPVPWVYCSEIFSMRDRAYGMAVAAATQWMLNFTVSKVTPYLVIALPNGKMFFLFGAINMVSACFGFWLPETRGLSIEEMDVLFGSTTQAERDANLARLHKEDDLGISKDKDFGIEHHEKV